MNERHVIPQGDFVFHDRDEDCVCGPDPEFVDGGVIYVHHSLDGREDARVQRMKQAKADREAES